MRFRSIGALCALAVSAVAQTSIPIAVQNSVLNVLATAIPRDQASYAVASPSAFAAQVASSFAAGNTPAWYQALPSEVKSLLPVLYPASASASPTPTPSASITITSVGTLSATSVGRNSTSLSGVRTPTLSPSAARSSAPVATANSAPHATAALGAGVGAALGFLGMLAL